MPRIADTNIDVEDTLERLGVEVVTSRGSWGDALCPFHPENNPSFSVHLDEGAWICRHGGERGQLLDLVVAVRECTRHEAATWLREQAPKEYSATDVLVKLFQLSEEHERDMSATFEWAERYDALDSNLMSDYFFARGFTTRTMRDFDVRFDEEQGVLIWPVRDEAANLVGFVKRLVPPNVGKRYEYPKGFQRVLHPLDHFVGHEAILVEGPLDALWLHQHGHTGGLAALGSDVTRHQVAWLRRNVTKVVVAFDNDQEGRAGRGKVLRALAGVYVLVARLPREAKDVQELDAVVLKEALESAVPAVLSESKGVQSG